MIKVGQTENLTNRLNYSKEYFDSVVSLKVYNLEGVDWRSLEEDLHNTHKECLVRFSHVVDSREYYHLSLLPTLIEFIESKIKYYKTEENNLTNFAHSIIPIVLLNNNKAVIDGKEYKISNTVKMLYAFHWWKFNNHKDQGIRYNPRLAETAKKLGVKVDAVKKGENLLFHMGLLSIDEGYIINNVEHLKVKLKS